MTFCQKPGINKSAGAACRTPPISLNLHCSEVGIAGRQISGARVQVGSRNCSLLCRPDRLSGVVKSINY
jgi:hypothetical protein